MGGGGRAHSTPHSASQALGGLSRQALCYPLASLRLHPGCWPSCHRSHHRAQASPTGCYQPLPRRVSPLTCCPALPVLPGHSRGPARARSRSQDSWEAVPCVPLTALGLLDPYRTAPSGPGCLSPWGLEPPAGGAVGHCVPPSATRPRRSARRSPWERKSEDMFSDAHTAWQGPRAQGSLIGK